MIDSLCAFDPSLRYGFVEFDDNRDADDAVYELNGKELCGERVVVEHARGPRRDRDSYGGGGGGGGYGGSDRGGGGDRGSGGGRSKCCLPLLIVTVLIFDEHCISFERLF